MKDDDLIRRGDALAELNAWFYDPQTDKVTDTRLQDAIRALPAAQPRVKPLVWSDPATYEMKTEYMTECRAYKVVEWSDRSGHVLFFGQARKPIRIDAPSEAVGADALKAAAQAHHAARILAALEPQPDPFFTWPPVEPQPDAAAIQEAALREIAESLLSLGDNLTYIAAATEAHLHSEAYALRANVLALIDNPGKDVMPDAAQSPPAGHDIGPGDQAVAGAAPVQMIYTNWRGETSRRMIIPRRVWFGSTDWHPEPQWLLKAIDTEKGEMRDFALKDFGGPVAPVTVQEAARVLLKWEAQQGAVFGACSGVVKVYRFNRVLESLAAVAQKGGE